MITSRRVVRFEIDFAQSKIPLEVLSRMMAGFFPLHMETNWAIGVCTFYCHHADAPVTPPGNVVPIWKWDIVRYEHRWEWSLTAGAMRIAHGFLITDGADAVQAQ